MENKTCPVCTELFTPKRKGNNAVYCSRRCAQRQPALGVVKTCEECQNQFVPRKWAAKQRFCSWECSRKHTANITRGKHRLPYKTTIEGRKNTRDAAKLQVMDKNPNWKGGRTHLSTGYVTLRFPNGVGDRLEHVVIAEQKYGRHVAPGEVVHHLNMNKSDNRPENLFICTLAVHNKIHHAYQKSFVAQTLHSDLVRVCESIKHALSS